MSLRAAARHAGMSAWSLGRLERGDVREPGLEQLCRAAHAVGLKVSLRLYPDGTRVRDTPQLGVLDRFARILAPPIRFLREVGLPIPGDLRAWDGRISAHGETASIDAESRLDDIQALTRRVELKTRDDPGAGVVILVVNRTAHNREVLALHREALRAQFPLDGAAITRALRAGRIPPASGILLV